MVGQGVQFVHGPLLFKQPALDGGHYGRSRYLLAPARVFETQQGLQKVPAARIGHDLQHLFFVILEQIWLAAGLYTQRHN